MAVSLGAMALAFTFSTDANGDVHACRRAVGPIALVAANLFVVGFGASWGPLVWVLLGEIFPNRIRGKALGVAAAAQWIANFLITVTLPALASFSLPLTYGDVRGLRGAVVLLRPLQDPRDQGHGPRGCRADLHGRLEGDAIEDEQLLAPPPADSGWFRTTEHAAERSGRIVVIGDALIDEIRDETGSRDFVGGAGLNVAVGLAVLGLPTTLLAMVGDDADGDAIRDHLDDYGVALVSSPAPLGTAHAVSDRSAGEPRYEFNESAQRRAFPFGDDARAAIDAASVVVVSCFPFDNASQADALASAVATARLVIDPNPRAGMMNDRAAFLENFLRAVGGSVLAKVGDEDAALLIGGSVEDLADRLLAAGAGAVLATAGSRGAEVRRADGTTIDVGIAALPGAVIDTMGAGDATLAATVHAPARGIRLHRRRRFVARPPRGGDAHRRGHLPRRGRPPEGARLRRHPAARRRRKPWASSPSASSSRLDGVVQAPAARGGPLRGGFEFGGWQAPYFDDESGR